MERTFRLQRICAVLFLVMSIALFVLSLGFMTDFKDLFGLQLKANKPVAYLHDVLLQGYNRSLFHLAVCALVVVVLSFTFEANRKVPDMIALVMMDALLAILFVRAVMLVATLAGLEPVYLSADYSKVRLEGGFDYVLRTRTFRLGYLVESLFALVCLVFGATLSVSHALFVRGEAGKK